MRTLKPLLAILTAGYILMFYLLALPLAAVLFYAIVFSLGLQWRTNWILYQVATPAGFIMFILSYLRVGRMKTATPGVRPTLHELYA